MILRLGREAIPEKIAEIPDPYNLRDRLFDCLSVKFGHGLTENGPL
jgi:hypothetical protein